LIGLNRESAILRKFAFLKGKLSLLTEIFPVSVSPVGYFCQIITKTKIVSSIKLEKLDN